jgi:hypothetical protein
MKTSPTRWYRDPLPQVDGWWLHCLLCASEPAMAAVVEPFREIILRRDAGPPPPCPSTPFNSKPKPLDFDDFLRGYVYMTTGFTRLIDEPIEMRSIYGLRVVPYNPLMLDGI